MDGAARAAWQEGTGGTQLFTARGSRNREAACPWILSESDAVGTPAAIAIGPLPVAAVSVTTSLCHSEGLEPPAAPKCLMSALGSDSGEGAAQVAVASLSWEREGAGAYRGNSEDVPQPVIMHPLACSW